MTPLGLDDSLIPDLSEGALLAGRYRIVKPLGQGGMAQVFLAVDERLDRRVAVKAIPRIVYGDIRCRKALEREAKLVMDLHHPRIRAVHNLEEDPQRKAAFLVMEYVEGISLDTLLAYREGEKLSEPEAVEIGLQVAEALAYAHGKGILHRDVKPKNVFLAGLKGEGDALSAPLPRDAIAVKLADFGLGTLVRESTSRLSNTDFTTSGTLHYMPPEQIKGAEPSPAMDIYALGATLYEALAGHVLYPRGEPLVQILDMAHTPAPLRGVSPALAAVVEKCLEKQPSQRFPSADAVLLALRQGTAAAAPDTPAAPPPPPAPEPAPKPKTARRSREKPNVEAPAQANAEAEPMARETAAATRAAQATGKQSRVKTRHRAALVVLLAVAVLAVGIVVYREAKARDSKYQALYEEGIAALQSHDFEAAVHAFTEAVRAKSTAEARAKLAEAERGQQQARKAGQYAEAVGRAQKYAANKEWALAKAAYEEALGYQDGPEARQGKARAEAALARRAGDTWVNPKDGLTYVWIPADSFKMGAVPGDSEARYWEKPRHPVTISKGFWLCRTEVTVGAYEKFCAATGRAMPQPPDCNPNWQYKDHPIVRVNWDDAVAYCQWAGGRLPTEAEWEYAARAGTETVYWWGNSYRQGMANCNETYGVSGGVYLEKTTPVGHYPANAWGLYDMLGNVWEWCADWYDDYASSPATDPTGPASGDERVQRGGSWCRDPTSLRVSYRKVDNPSYRSDDIGFRCVRDE
jgi:formylglycine-generating enzyme required for sulfatase activity/serine/threonine protein kinase